MADEQKTAKLKKEDHDLLKRALKTHEHLTGERASHLADSIPVDEGEDAEAKAKREQDAYNKRAELNQRVEETQQAERRARQAADGGTGQSPSESPNTPGSTQPGNPGGGNEALATEKAKAQGKDRKGDEPDSAKPSK